MGIDDVVARDCDQRTRCMNIALAVDNEFWLNPNLVSSIRDPDSMVVFGGNAAVELSLDLFRVLMVFAGKTTIREAYRSLDVDVDIEEFAKIVSDFVDRGLLRHDHAEREGIGLQHLLNPDIVWSPALIERVSAWMRQGRIVVVPNALPLEFAERVHSDLDRSTDWTAVEDAYDFFHFRACTMDRLDGRSAALTECSRVFKSAMTRRFIGELSGEDCSGEAGVIGTWYRPGEYALPHHDLIADNPRSVAFVWYLAKDWRSEWGGALFWGPTGQYIRPQFNTLVTFSVLPSSIHLVCPVSPCATAKRLTINGFWCRRTPGLSLPPIGADAMTSPRAYGQHEPENPESAIIVL